MLGQAASGRAGDLVGYARASTRDQTVALQLDALNAAGCVRVFEGNRLRRAARPAAARSRP